MPSQGQIQRFDLRSKLSVGLDPISQLRLTHVPRCNALDDLNRLGLIRVQSISISKQKGSGCEEISSLVAIDKRVISYDSGAVRRRKLEERGLVAIGMTILRTK